MTDLIIGSVTTTPACEAENGDQGERDAHTMAAITSDRARTVDTSNTASHNGRYWAIAESSVSHSASGSGSSQYDATRPVGDACERGHAGIAEVGAAVAGHEHCRPPSHDVVEVLIAELLEHGAVVAVPVEPDDAAALEHALHRDVEVGRREDLGHVGDPADEREAPDPGQDVVDRVHERERELGELGDRARDVAQHDDVRPVRMSSPERRVDRDAAGLEGTPERPSRIEAARRARPATATDASGELSGQRLQRAPELGQLGARQRQDRPVERADR